jgi:glycosyltransferase involved in cell wall biosynthesis
MKVLVVNNMAPFIQGGAEHLARHLALNIEVAGHSAEVVRIPFSWEPAARIPSQMLLARTLELANVDRVIALKFPAYLVRHPTKVIWLLHQYRQAYDLFETEYSNLRGTGDGAAIRDAIRAADNQAFRESRAIFTNSKTTRDRLVQYNAVDAAVLLPPVNDPESFGGGQPGDYLFVGGRVNAMKRQHLVIEALSHAARDVKIVVAGPPDSPADRTRLEKAIVKHHLKGRVHLDLRYLPRNEYADYINHARAVAYLPVDEDSLGYVAMEAALARKPLISAEDSGGILGLAIDGGTGWVVEPSAKALGDALTAAWTDAPRGKALGDGAYRRWTELGIGWPQTVETLLT